MTALGVVEDLIAGRPVPADLDWLRIFRPGALADLRAELVAAKPGGEDEVLRLWRMSAAALASPVTRAAVEGHVDPADYVEVTPPFPTAGQAVEALRGATVPVDAALAGAPEAPGLYAWWGQADLLPGINAGPAHPSEPDMRLYYVGISSSLRRRLRTHARGSTGSSTLRRALAALLSEQERWATVWTATRVVPDPASETALTAWITEHLRVTWTVHPAPGEVEEAVIASLRPPLNLDHAVDESVRAHLSAVRARWRASAGPRPDAR